MPMLTFKPFDLERPTCGTITCLWQERILEVCHTSQPRGMAPVSENFRTPVYAHIIS